jgi:hypothetical protein
MRQHPVPASVARVDATQVGRAKLTPTFGGEQAEDRALHGDAGRSRGEEILAIRSLHYLGRGSQFLEERNIVGIGRQKFVCGLPTAGEKGHAGKGGEGFVGSPAGVQHRPERVAKRRREPG